MYGVRVATAFICSIFAVAFSGSAAKLKDLQVRETCLWTEAFVDLRDFISVGLDLLAKETDKFFQILLTGRDALLCNLRVGSAVVKPAQPNNNVHKQMVK
uniref:Bypass1 n=1 Tax=Solanum tuberosum TaxID=4113 RepID=M1AC60_SOLTU